MREAEWDFYENLISYQHYDDLIDIGEIPKTVPTNQLVETLNMLDQQLIIGKSVSISLYWKGDLPRIEVTFQHKNDIGFYLDDSRPTLECNSRYTDYSWFLTRILCPIAEKVNVLSVTCSDIG